MGKEKMKILWIIMPLVLFFYLPPTYADECIEGNCTSGHGTMLYSTGHKYIGEFKDARRDGNGILFLPGGRKLEGVWENGEIIEGTYTQPDGTEYVGHWKFLERNGQGELTYPDGSKYIGEFKSGHKHGKGTMTYPDGRKYIGDFKFGERTGNGTMIYPDGRKYIGEFKDGERSGHGTLIYPDGKKLVGEFKDGEFLGN